MLHASSTSSGGELQLSTNCSVRRVPLERGDIAVYRSRHRHRVTAVTAPRTVMAVEWWRGEQTELPHRPGAPGISLQEPDGPADGTTRVGGGDAITPRDEALAAVGATADASGAGATATGDTSLALEL